MKSEKDKEIERAEPSRGAPDAAHTPGPWRAAMHLIGDDPRWFIEHEGVFIKTATIAAMNSTCMAYDNAEADAALIAQAPTLLAENEKLRAGHVVLLEALRRRQKEGHGHGCIFFLMNGNRCDCGFVEAEAAILQAERT